MDTVKLSSADVAYARGVADGWQDAASGTMYRWQRMERGPDDDSYNAGHTDGWIAYLER